MGVRSRKMTVPETLQKNDDGKARMQNKIFEGKGGAFQGAFANQLVCMGVEVGSIPMDAP